MGGFGKHSAVQWEEMAEINGFSGKPEMLLRWERKTLGMELLYQTSLLLYTLLTVLLHTSTNQQRDPDG